MQGVILLRNSASVKIPHNQLANTANQITMFNTVIPLMHTAKLCIHCVLLHFDEKSGYVVDFIGGGYLKIN